MTLEDVLEVALEDVFEEVFVDFLDDVVRVGDGIGLCEVVGLGQYGCFSLSSWSSRSLEHLDIPVGCKHRFWRLSSCPAVAAPPKKTAWLGRTR